MWIFCPSNGYILERFWTKLNYRLAVIINIWFSPIYVYSTQNRVIDNSSIRYSGMGKVVSPMKVNFPLDINDLAFAISSNIVWTYNLYSGVQLESKRTEYSSIKDFSLQITCTTDSENGSCRFKWTLTRIYCSEQRTRDAVHKDLAQRQ